MPQSLPIDSHLPEILGSLEKHGNLVLQASPGSGKTTRVPPALLRARFIPGDAEILVLEPRRLAAKWAARRVAEELGEEVGQTVGYQFRFENVSSRKTRLRFLTEGMLMRRLLTQPDLSSVKAVVLDEFHERHLHGDIALSYLRWLQSARRPDLKIIVMSATLESRELAAFLQGAPIISIEAERFPVETHFLPSGSQLPLERSVRNAVISAIRANEEQGDILVFLPGMAEIRRTGDALDDLTRENDFLVLPLHGDLSREEQDLAMLPANRRKVILSTNIAETSLTIEGVTTVIDSGLHRQASYSWWSGVPSLKTRPISRASAIQRAGRAGRTRPGQCFRLYTRADFESRLPFDTPEILRADLSQTYLELKALSVRNPFGFPWFEAPPRQSLESARELLYRLGAFAGPDPHNPEAPLSELGKRMVKMPAHPRLSRMLLEAEKTGVLGRASELAALIQEGALEQLDALEQLEHFSSMRPWEKQRIQRVKTQLLSGLEDSGSRELPADWKARLAFALLCGFPDRVAIKRSEGQLGEDRSALLLSSGGSADLENPHLFKETTAFVTLDIQEHQHQNQARARLKIRSVCSIQPEWLFDLEPSLVQEKEELLWEKERSKVLVASKISYDQIVLAEDRKPAPNSISTLHFLLKQGVGIDLGRLKGAAVSDWIQAFSPIVDPEAFESLLARLSLAGQASSSAALADAIDGILMDRVDQIRSLADLREIEWEIELPSRLGLHSIEELAPKCIMLPSGRRARVQYKLGQPPWIESRLQDFFGMRKGPAILNQKLPLVLHLLAPNQRAVQVTSDLQGFWDRAYPEIRKELCRRYPKHDWPVDPVNGPFKKPVTRPKTE